jgi:hypothetical protein
MYWDKIAIFFGVATLASPSALAADLVTVTPGMWESTVTIESSFMPSMPPQTTQECVRESVYDIKKMLRDQGDCRITDTSVTGSTLRWTMACDTEGGPNASGRGEVTSHGDRVEGNMSMKMSVQGQTMDMKTVWTGKRLGDC